MLAENNKCVTPISAIIKQVIQLLSLQDFLTNILGFEQVLSNSNSDALLSINTVSYIFLFFNNIN